MLPTNEGCIRARDKVMEGAGREEWNGDFSKPLGVSLNKGFSVLLLPSQLAI
jgi:hypothetical protein